MSATKEKDQFAHDIVNEALSAESLYLALEQSPSGFFLEDTRESGRYIIASFSADKTIQIKNKSCLKELEKKSSPAPKSIQHLPFTGGAIGLVHFEYAYSLFEIDTEKEEEAQPGCEE